MLRILCVCGLLLCVAFPHSRLCGDEQPRRTDPRQRNPEEMAEGLEPLAAAARMQVPPGFRVQLAAGEPDVHQPIALCFDDRGRLWIAEAHTYPLRAPEGQGRDRILIFEDTDHDGTLDRSKVFVEGLNLVSGLEVGFGGIFVGAAPYLLFLPDRNGDDLPDAEDRAADPTRLRRSQLQFPGDVPPGAIVLRDGFGWEDTHETLNAFIWGPDGWLYGCHGVFTHSLVGRPGDPAEARIPVNAAVWRYHPQQDQFETFMQGTSNPWGVDFNDHGQAFLTACVIPHLWHVIQGARYQRQGGQHFNPYTYDDIRTIADHQHYAGNIRDHAWWGHEPRIGDATSDAGGGHAHAGAMVYLGDNWPAEYRNRIFFSNIHGNRVNCDIPERTTDGSGYVGRHGSDLLLARDLFFRGINLRYGPDGSVCLIDWYDRNACHRTNPQIWDRSSGRIFRIAYGQPEPRSVDLGRSGEAELIELMNHANDWFVRTARRQLMQRGCSPTGHERLWNMTNDLSRTAEKRLRSLWTLHATGGLTPARSDQLLHDTSEYVRAWTIQLELEDRTASAGFLSQLVRMASADPSAVVRLYLASALQRLPPEHRWDLAAALAGRAEDADDHNLPLLLWYGVEPLVPVDPARALQLALQAKIETLSRFIVRRAAAQDDTIEPAVAALMTTDLPRQTLIMSEMLLSFEGRVGIRVPPAWQAAYTRIREQSAQLDPTAATAAERKLHQSLRDQADQIAVIFGDQRVFGVMRRLLTDPDQDLPRRRQALDILVRGQDTATGELLLTDAVLKTSELQSPAVRALVTLGTDHTSEVLLMRWKSFGETARSDVINTLVSRPAWAAALLAAVGAGQIPARDLQAYHVRQILEFRNPELAGLLKQHWGEIREPDADRRQLIAEWKARLTPAVLAAAHRGNGRRIFSRTCQNCHRLFGTGGEIGPDITGSNRADLEYILENLLDPGAVVGRAYRLTLLELKDGRIVSGLVQKETDSALTIQTINDRIVVPVNQIEERTLSAVSIMPERQLDPLSRDEVRDLIAYLASPTQVAMSGPPAPIDPTSGRVPDAVEGESMMIVEKTGGSVSGQSMSDFAGDRWSGNDHLWWTGAEPGDRLALELPVSETGSYTIEAVLTRAPDYGVVSISLGRQVLDAGIDLYHSPDVVTTGVLSFPQVALTQGSHRLTLEITGANPAAVKSFMVGLDYVRLIPVTALGDGQHSR